MAATRSTGATSGPGAPSGTNAAAPASTVVPWPAGLDPPTTDTHPALDALDVAAAIASLDAGPREAAELLRWAYDLVA